MKVKRKQWSRAIAFLLMITICFGMPLLQFPAVEAQAASTTDGLEYTVDDDRIVIITGYNGSATKIQIPAEIDGCPVTCIGSGAFENCSSLTSIEIPDSVASIFPSAFKNCSSLTSIEIPVSVMFIDNRAFDGCSSLTEIEVDSKNADYASDAGVLFDKELTTIITCPGGKEGEYSIPNSVMSIGDWAFSGCSRLTSIEIPNSVTDIEEYAFYGCSSLTSIEIPNSVTSIGDGAFNGCSSLTSIEIPDSVTGIGNWAFSGCSSLASIEIPDSVTDIGSGAFYGCSSLTDINIPNSVMSIRDSAFDGCSSLTSIEIPDSVTGIGDWAFLDCSSLTSIEIPDSVTSIGEYAFVGCSSLTQIGIPDSVTSIGNNAFLRCSTLTGINVDPRNKQYASIEGVLLNKELTTLIICPKGKEGKYSIPDSVTSIEDGAFLGCSSLTSIEVPGTVTDIGNGAFEECSSLTSIKIPASVTSVGSSVFWGCISLTSIKILGSVTNIGSEAFYGCSSLVDIEIPDSVTDIGSKAFYGCSSLVGIEIPDSVTSIGNNAFSLCSNLSKIEIPDSGTSIGRAAFWGCISLTRIEIPDSITSIVDYAFSYCSNLLSIKIPANIEFIGSHLFSATAIDHVIFEGNEDAWKSLIADSENSELQSASTIHYNTTGDIFIQETSVQPDCVNNGHTSYKCPLCEKEYAFDIVSPTGHCFENDICSKCSRKREDCIESAHPYKDYLKTYTIERPRAIEIIVTFSSATMLFEEDTISIYDKEDNLIGEYHGKELAGQQIRVKGDTVKIKLESDEIGLAYGFAVSDIEVIMTDPTEPTPPDAFEVSVTADRIASIDGYTGTEIELVIPEEINGYKIAAISDGAFKDSPVTSIVLPETVTKIGAGAFAGSSLKRITITANEIEIAGDAFEGCEDVTICCYFASKAYAFAQAHGIAVELLDAKPAVVYGDLDGSGSVDANDALVILKIAAKLQTPTEEQRIAGDVNNSGSVDANDALDVLKKAAKLIDVFPAEGK